MDVNVNEFEFTNTKNNLFQIFRNLKHGLIFFS